MDAAKHRRHGSRGNRCPHFGPRVEEMSLLTLMAQNVVINMYFSRFSSTDFALLAR
jgi:hypothetical protein